MNNIIYLVFLLFGWGLGMLINYLADVLPRKRKLATPFCLHCDSLQSWGNYLFFPRRCMHCGHKRIWRVLVVELLVAFLTGWLWFYQTNGLDYVLSLVITLYFIIIFVIDIEHRLIMHPLSVVGAVLGGFIGIWEHGLINTIYGGLAGFGLMLLIYFLGWGFILIVSRWRKGPIDREAIGFGDVNMSGVIGLLLGWPGVIAGLLLAIILGGIVSLLILIWSIVVHRYKPLMAIPYGPFLIISTWFLMIFSTDIQTWLTPR